MGNRMRSQSGENAVAFEVWKHRAVQLYRRLPTVSEAGPYVPAVTDC